MSKAIRLSPSGPVIGNAGGGPFQPGKGARLRLVETTSTVSGTSGALFLTAVPVAIGPNFGAQPLQVGFLQSSPDYGGNPALEYRATLIADVFNPTTNAGAQVELYIDASTDGATWVEVASNAHSVGQNSVRQVRCDLPLVIGTSVGAIAGESLIIRGRIGASAGGGATGVQISAPGTAISGPGTDPLAPGKGALLLQLEECF